MCESYNMLKYIDQDLFKLLEDIDNFMLSYEIPLWLANSLKNLYFSRKFSGFLCELHNEIETKNYACEFLSRFVRVAEKMQRAYKNEKQIKPLKGFIERSKGYKW